MIDCRIISQHVYQVFAACRSPIIRGGTHSQSCTPSRAPLGAILPLSITGSRSCIDAHAFLATCGDCANTLRINVSAADGIERKDGEEDKGRGQVGDRLGHIE